jgi:hypothetical protein
LRRGIVHPRAPRHPRGCDDRRAQPVEQAFSLHCSLLTYYSAAASACCRWLQPTTVQLRTPGNRNFNHGTASQEEPPFKIENVSRQDAFQASSFAAIEESPFSEWCVKRPEQASLIAPINEMTTMRPNERSIYDKNPFVDYRKSLGPNQ